MARHGEREVLIEMVPVGASVKVSAVDVKTGTEVTIIGPRSAGEEMLKRTAVRKLDYVLSQRCGHGKPAAPGSKDRSDGGGWRV